MSTETYQCQTCGEVTPDGKCGCVGITTAKIILSCQECESLKADNAALRKVLEAVHTAIKYVDHPTEIIKVLNLIEQTLSKGKTE